MAPMLSSVLLNTSDSWTAFVKSFGVILASEIGDKTFFIAAVMAMKNSRLAVSALPCDSVAAASRLLLPGRRPNLVLRLVLLAI